MWLRNLFFLGVLFAGASALIGALFPSQVPPRLQHADVQVTLADDFPAAVARVDAVFRKEWQREGLKPAGRADDLAIARRLSLGLTGTIPSLQEVRQFEALPEKERIARWLAGILADRRYGDYFAERFARAYVGTEDGPFIVYRRRRFVAWLSDEFMRNRPYDQLTRDLISSRGLWTDVPATNFVTVTFDQEKKRPDPERLAGRVSRAFLGIRIDCAQCHDHPFEPWSQKDFRSLAAFFSEARQGFTGIYDELAANGKFEFEVENKKTKQKEIIAPKAPEALELMPSHGTRRAQLAGWITHPKNPYFARATVNRVWALMFGRPLVDPVDNLPVKRSDDGRLAAADADAKRGEVADDASDERRAHPALEVLAEDFVAHGYDMRRLINLIVATQVFQLDSGANHELTDQHYSAWAAFPISRLRPEQVAGSLLQAAAVETIDGDSHILTQFIRNNEVRDFVRIYGDTGEDEFDSRGGTIPQRLLLMNGPLVREKTKDALFNASTRIGQQAPTDRAAVETAYLAVLTRRPTAEEAEHFASRLDGTKRNERSQRMEDLYWTLLNATEFSWNH
ncbi:hypothetical protein AYO40_04085 [Planctomycetaceae bacterium SCGC AG-212-D15]|nr:hypothetical protein AYO40_04085 [Planctomycetaceae bacterium SCGC AG-212-D15]